MGSVEEVTVVGEYVGSFMVHLLIYIFKNSRLHESTAYFASKPLAKDTLCAQTYSTDRLGSTRARQAWRFGSRRRLSDTLGRSVKSMEISPVLWCLPILLVAGLVHPL